MYINLPKNIPDPFNDKDKENDQTKDLLYRIKQDTIRKEQEQKTKWNSWFSRHFPYDYEKKKEFAYMPIDKLAEYFVANENEFPTYKEFIQERCDAEKFGGYSDFCFKVKRLREGKNPKGFEVELK